MIPPIARCARGDRSSFPLWLRYVTDLFINLCRRDRQTRQNQYQNGLKNV